MVARAGPAVVSTDPPAYTRTTLIKVALGRIRGFYAPRGGSKEGAGKGSRGGLVVSTPRCSPPGGYSARDRVVDP
jgi:hypothetical protein